MDENQFSLGDLVAHKHYPGIAIGRITQFYASGRVGISGDRARSFLPKNLVLVKETQISKELAKEITGSENTHRGWAQARAEQAAQVAAAKAAAIEKETNELIEMLEEKLAASQTEVMELSPVPPAQAEELTEHSENCSQCGSQDIRRFHYHDPNEYYFYCRDCGHEGWRHEKLPPAQVEFEEVMEVEEVDAMATPAEDIAKQAEAIDTQSEAIATQSEAISTQSEALNTHSEAISSQSEAISSQSEAIASSEVMEHPPTTPLSIFQKFDLVASQPEKTIAQIVESRLENFPPIKWQIPELPPIPRDFSELDELPEWWERPILSDFRECNCGEPYDDDDDLDWVQETYGVDATYRGWKLTMNDGHEIYATPPNRDRLYHCECELDLDGPDGQIALAQEFIDSWYFAQPSPGQLSLNIPEAVARDPPPRFG